MQANTILQVNASSRYEDSITRRVSASLISLLKQKNPSLERKERDVAKGLPFIDEPWVEANFTPIDERTEQHQQTLQVSNGLVSELQQAKIIVIAAPLYNFSIPATLKTWIDLIARAGLTFRYTENGPQGLLEHKKVYIVMASGGVPIGSEMDYASPYLKVVLGFIGLSDVTVIDSSQLNSLETSEELFNQLTSLLIDEEKNG